MPHTLHGLALLSHSFSTLLRLLRGLSLRYSLLPNRPPYLLLLLLFVLLCEEGVDPPDLGEHAAVGQAEAEAEEPQAELKGRRGETVEDKRSFYSDV